MVEVLTTSSYERPSGEYRSYVLLLLLLWALLWFLPLVLLLLRALLGALSPKSALLDALSPYSALLGARESPNPQAGCSGLGLRTRLGLGKYPLGRLGLASSSESEGFRPSGLPTLKLML